MKGKPNQVLVIKFLIWLLLVELQVDMQHLILQEVEEQEALEKAEMHQ